MLAERRIAEELMDDPDLDPAIYAAVLKDLASVNRVTMAGRPTLAFLERAIGGRTAFSLLDVGFGDGDMLRRIARWADRRGIKAQLTGVDLNAKSLVAAQAHTPADMPIDYVAGDYAAFGGQQFDVVISSLVVHHMTHEQLIAFLRFMQRETRIGWFINDLHRHPLAWAGFGVLARLFGWHPIVRHDGQLSVARSYRPSEWPPILIEAGIAPEAVAIQRWLPFRLCVAAIH